MTTPVVLTGFEHGVTPVTQGGGLCDFVWGTANVSYSISSAIKNTGDYSLKIVNTTTTRGCVGWAITSSSIIVSRFYVRIDSETSITDLFHTNMAVGAYLLLCIDPSDHKFKIVETATDSVLAVGPSYTTGQFYGVDIKVNLSSNPNIMTVTIDGTEFVGSYAQAATTSTSVRLGSAGSNGLNNDYTAYFDDFIISLTNSDYPIGPGGTQALRPASDGTHSIAANTLEDQTGADINGSSVFAYNLINSNPINTSSYILQNNASATSYAEVLFENISAVHSAIIAAFGYLAYTSATTSTNNGATIVSKDDFATSTGILGTPASPADMSDGSLTGLFFKKALISGVVDDTTVNNLKARLGYSADATPDPYWVDLLIEVGYTVPASNDIMLDLVSFSSTDNPLVLLENILDSMDLVSYSNNYNSILFNENIDTFLDLVSYSLNINNITETENVLDVLDLVSYSNIYNLLTTIENTTIQLDTVSNVIFVNDVVIVENQNTILDLVLYSDSFNNIVLLAEGDINLDLVLCSVSFNDLIVLESSIINLDLSVFNSFQNDLTFIENEISLLDLVVYSLNLNDVLFYLPYSQNFVPFERTFAIKSEKRIIEIPKQNRTYDINKDYRIISVEN